MKTLIKKIIGEQADEVRYICVCDDCSYVGEPRRTREEAYRDCKNHTSQEGNEDHSTRVVIQQNG